MTGGKKDGAAVLFLLLVVVLYFAPILFEGRTLFFRDIAGLLYPFYHFLSQSLREGVYPLWNPYVFNGAPFLAAFAPGIFYPPALLFLLDDFTLAFNLFSVCHYALFTVSVYALARDWGMSSGAALCSAATALLGGFFLSSIYFFLALSWSPPVFLCFRKYLLGGKMRHFAGTAACISLQLLCGPPETCFMTLALAYLHSLSFEKAKGASGNALLLAGAVVSALGLAAPQWLSTLALLKETVRSGGLVFADHAFWSLEPKVLPTIFLPKDFTGFMERVPPETFGFFQSFHMGVFAAFSLCASLLFLRRREVRFWLAVFAVGLFFSLGKYNPVYEFVYAWFPFLKFFRYPEKFYLFSALAQIFLTGYTADELVRTPHKTAGFFAVLAMVCAAIFGASYLVAGSKPLASLACLAVFGACGHMFFSGKMPGSALKAVLLLLIFFDLALKHYTLVPMIDKKFFEEKPAVARQIKQDKDLFRVYPADIQGDLESMAIPPEAESFLMIQITRKERLHPNWGVNYGIAYPDGLIGMGMELQDARLWGEIFEKAPPEKRARILRRGNVKYIVAGDETAIEGRVRALDNVLPRAFLVARHRPAKAPELLNTYYGETFDPRQEVLLSEPVDAAASDEFEGGVEIVRYEPNRVTLRSHQNSEGFLVLLDSWFPGWTATVDGRPAHIYRANYFYRAVKTGSGIHAVEFSFEAPGYRAGLFISGATACILLAGMTARLRKKAVK